MRLFLLLLTISSVHGALSSSRRLAALYPRDTTACSTLQTSLTLTNKLLEGFETPTTGYEHLYSGVSYTETGTTANISPASDSSALTTGKPAGACNQAWRLTVPTDGTETFAQWDNGSSIDVDASGFVMSFYIYVETAPDNGENYTVMRVSTTADATTAQCTMAVNTGTLQIRCTASTSSNYINLTPNSWNLVVVTLDSAGAAGGSTIAVNGGSAETFTRTAGRDVQILKVGASLALDANDSGTFSIDLVALGTP